MSRRLVGRCVVVVVLSGGCVAGEAPVPDEVDAPAASIADDNEASIFGDRFVEVTATSGVDFFHRSDETAEYAMPAIMGGGAAVFDIEGDGDPDLYFVNGAGFANRVYLQESPFRFVDATDGSGLAHEGAGMGVAVGDIDNDGDLDVFVSNHGPDALFRNEGGARFSDVSESAGIAGGGWSTSAAFLDFDRDGLLDLFVARYVDWDPDVECAAESGRRDYCGPAQFPGVADRLYRNLDGRRFEDVTRPAGIAMLEDAGLGVVVADFDGDTWPDLYVVNDADPNHLWINRGDGTFVEDGMLLGLAFNRYGVGEAGMGVSVGDGDGDLDLDVFVTHLIQETNTYYENRGPAGFEDATAAVGLALSSVPYTSFGTAFFDGDDDGDLDLGIANGAVKRRPSPLGEGEQADYAEPNQLLENDGSGAWHKAEGVTDFTGPVEISRGLIPADLDRDGDVDLVLTNLEGPARIFSNEGPVGGSVAVRAVDPALNRAALGAIVVASTATGDLVRAVSSDGGYLTAVEPLARFGLGEESGVERFVVHWPDGSSEAFDGAPSGDRVDLRRGEGRPAGGAP